MSLLSKRPAWLKRDADTSKPSPSHSHTPKKANDLFNRSVSTSNFKKEQEERKREKEERRRLRKERKEQKRLERKRESSEEAEDEPVPAPAPARLSPKLDLKRKKDGVAQEESPRDESPSPIMYDNSGTPTPRKKRKILWEKEGKIRPRIELGDGDIELKKSAKAGKEVVPAPRLAVVENGRPATAAITLTDDENNLGKPPDEENDDTKNDSDSDVERLARRAEARKRREAQSHSTSNGRTGASPTFRSPKRPPPAAGLTPRPPSSTSQPANPTARPPSSTPASTQPILTIFINSFLPNTSPIMFRIHLDHKLRIIRQKFCERYALPPDIAKEVFLKWRDFKLYDSTTCKTMGITVDEGTGEVLYRDKVVGRTDGDGPDPGLVFEAWTPQLVKEDEQRRREEKENERKAKEAKEAKEAKMEGGNEKVKVKRTDGVTVTVRAKGIEDWTISVYPETTFKRLIAAYRKMRKIEETKSISIVFDGDRMEEDTTMQQAEIEDSVTLDAHIK